MLQQLNGKSTVLLHCWAWKVIDVHTPPHTPHPVLCKRPQTWTLSMYYANETTHTHFHCRHFYSLARSYLSNRGQSVTWYNPMGHTLYSGLKLIFTKINRWSYIGHRIGRPKMSPSQPRTSTVKVRNVLGWRCGKRKTGTIWRLTDFPLPPPKKREREKKKRMLLNVTLLYDTPEVEIWFDLLVRSGNG